MNVLDEDWLESALFCCRSGWEIAVITTLRKTAHFWNLCPTFLAASKLAPRLGWVLSGVIVASPCRILKGFAGSVHVIHLMMVQLKVHWN